MTADRAALVHRARMIIMDGLHDAKGLQLSDVDAVIDLALEEAARVAFNNPNNGTTIAAAIRALKD